MDDRTDQLDEGPFDPKEITDFERLGNKFRFPRGSTLIEEGDEESTDCFFLRSGFVKVQKRRSGHTEQHSETADQKGRRREDPWSFLGIRRRGDLVGERAALFGEPRSANLVALTDVEAILIPGNRWRDYCEIENPRIYKKLWGVEKAREAESTRRRLESYLAIERRLAKVLYELVTQGPSKATEEGVEVELSQEDLALLIGVSRELISPVVRAFKNNGVVRVARGKTVVLDENRLRMIADGDHTTTS